MFLVNNRDLTFASPEMLAEVSAARDAYRSLVWNLGILTSRIKDDALSQAATGFHTAFASSDHWLGHVDPKDAIGDVFLHFNTCNRLARTFLADLDARELEEE